MKNLFKTKEAKRRDAIKDYNSSKTSLWQKVISLFKIAFTAMGKQEQDNDDIDKVADRGRD